MKINIVKIKLKTKESFSSKLLGSMLMFLLVEASHLLATYLFLIWLIDALCGSMLHGLPHSLPTSEAKQQCIFTAFTTLVILKHHTFALMGTEKSQTQISINRMHCLSINYAGIVGNRFLRDWAGGNATIWLKRIHHLDQISCT